MANDLDKSEVCYNFIDILLRCFNLPLISVVF